MEQLQNMKRNEALMMAMGTASTHPKGTVIHGRNVTRIRLRPSTLQLGNDVETARSAQREPRRRKRYPKLLKKILGFRLSVDSRMAVTVGFELSQDIIVCKLLILYFRLSQICHCCRATLPDIARRYREGRSRISKALSELIRTSSVGRMVVGSNGSFSSCGFSVFPTI
jgi:hypothetical protein